MRRNSSMVWSLDSLHKVGWASSKAIGILAELVRARDSLLVVGGTSSGKTTVLSSLIREIPEMERVICLEDTHELGRPTPAGLQLLTRSDAKGVLREISLSDLVRQALRMRPDRLVLGEVRGPEAKDLLMALATGHDGSLGTLHANSAAEALLRLEMLIQLGAPQWSLNSIRRLIFLALRYIVVVKRNRLGQRKLEGIFRLASMEEFGILVEKVDV